MSINSQQQANLAASWSGSGTAPAGSVLNATMPNPEIPYPGSVSVSVQGTFSATFQFEATADGINYVAINGLPPSSSTGASSTSAAGVWQFNVAGLVGFRVRCSTYASGTGVVTINQSPAYFA